MELCTFVVFCYRMTQMILKYGQIEDVANNVCFANSKSYAVSSYTSYIPNYS